MIKKFQVGDIQNRHGALVENFVINSTFDRVRSLTKGQAETLQTPTQGHTIVNLTNKQSDYNIMIAEPCASDLLYTWDILKNVLPDDIKVLSDLTDKAHFVRVVINIVLDLEYRCFESRFEVVSSGASSKFGVIVGDYRGFIDFTVGPFCAMYTLWLLGEVTGKVPKVDAGELIPPLPPTADEAIGSDEIVLVNSTYFSRYNVEVFPDVLNGEESTIPYSTLRMYLDPEDTYPTPGEFLTIAIGANPEHVWFYQETSPYNYSGNWFETSYYSSGTIVSVLDIGDDDFTYTVLIQGIEYANVISSDYETYVVDERVTLMKNMDYSKDTMIWKDLVPYSDWIIIPITFYKEVI
ncbi:MAG TPA: hypothetical protein ENI76_02840 [Ignavibacteria bacterium]|nr:hypothetical protein [Ignavibacteria bacterium]